MCVRVNDLNLSDRQSSAITKLKLNTFRGLCVIAACALTYRTVATSESLTPDVAFQTIPPYVQVLITAISSGTLQVVPKRNGGSTSGNHKTKNVRLVHWAYWTLTFASLIVSDWLRSLDTSRGRFENVYQVLLHVIPLLYEMYFCHICMKFKNKYQSLNKIIEDEHLTAKRLLAVREERKILDERTGKTIGGAAFGAQVLSEIAATAITTVYKIHSVLRSSSDGTGTASSTAADLLAVLHRVFRLYALCKVSGDVAKEANGIVSHLLNITPSTDENLENEISFFLWEVVNPPSEVRMVYGTFALSPRLFVAVFSWCVGFILILLQFRWPRTY